MSSAFGIFMYRMQLIPRRRECQPREYSHPPRYVTHHRIDARCRYISILEALSISTSNLSKFQRLVSKHYSALTAGPIAAEIWQNKAASFSDPILPNQDDISLHTEPGTRDQRSKKFIGPRRDLGEDFERKKAGWFSPDYFGVRDSSPSASEVSRHR